MSEVTFAQLHDAGRRRACMAKVTVIRFVLLGLSFAITACSGGDGGSSASVLESCAGSYVCVIGGNPVESDLVKSGGSCYLGSLELRADGTAPSINGDPTTWSGDASKLYICSGSTCFACEPSGAPVAASSSSGSCTGTAESCSSVGASSCSDQGGCNYTVGSDVSTTSDDGCDGDPRPCSDYKNDATGCKGHRGCTWH
jgi:hypothetical protein